MSSRRDVMLSLSIGVGQVALDGVPGQVAADLAAKLTADARQIQAVVGC